MKVGIITFHASHNYGSMLQSYALQQIVMRLGHECEIINFRTERQKKFYYPFFMENRFKAKAKAFLYPKIAFNDWRKYRLFECFLKERLFLSEKEYSTSEELADAGFDYDAYISGSDQIWNTYCLDFDWAFFLNFVKEGRRIAYAPSMGPVPESEVKEEFDRLITESLSHYDTITVREERTRLRLEKAGVRETMSIALDPTLLLGRADWGKLVSERPLVKGVYIFLYSPCYNESVYEEALLLAKEKGLKIVVSKSDGIRKWGKDGRFDFYTAVGPLEFLNLIKYAKIVIAESFHAVVFSLVFNRPFIISKGDVDSRMSNLLSLSGLDSKCVRANGSLSFNPTDTIDFPERISNEVYNSISFLKNALS